MMVYTGVINALAVPKGLIFEMGGGSTKLIYYSRKTLVHYASMPFGAVTLTDIFKHDGLSAEEKAQRIETLVKEHLMEIEWLKEIEPETQLICVGGSFRNLGRISRRIRKYPLDMIHNYHVGIAEFSSIYATIRTLELDKTSRIKGLSGERADIFPSSLSALKALTDHCHFQNIIISGSGLREGAMFRYAVPTTLEKPISDILGYSVHTIFHNFGMNITHAEQVYNLSLQLFKQLKVLHKLPRAYLKVLKVASLLHDCGKRLKFYDHNRHSQYIILHSNLYGISHRDLVMASFVAAAHKKGEDILFGVEKYKDILLSNDDLEAIVKLGVILRIAESFDRTMSGLISGINCDVLGDSVIMKTECEGDCSLEIKEALRSSADFKKAYRKNLEII